ncbi:6866_t:CDS:2 [Entrophospora sp. SA101]|nr:6866_t:CDS:2 [Entrophospora sp. SA101]CAJ0828375.1 4476_t:CDS:2 [Entrophospora sp. SA101]CAJ0895984.1 13757_t:CDS:2 [Entrophospora sp. SA101]
MGKKKYERRTILLIGRTGNGKSALANVISDSEIFKESAGSISQTRSANIQEVLIDGVLFKLIDTVGLGDTKLTTQQVLYKLAEAAHSIKNGLNQILFVTSGRFTKEEVESYDLLRSIIFNNDVVKYTTIVRTTFPEFEDVEKKVIHVDNPPLIGRAKETNRITRNESRKRILLHLSTCKEVYRPENLDQLNERIGNYMTEKEMLEKIVSSMEEDLKVQQERMERQEEEMSRQREEAEIKMKNLNEEMQKEILRQLDEADRKFQKEMEEQRRAAEEQKRATEAEVERLKDEIARQAREHVKSKGFLQRIGEAIDNFFGF